MWPLVDPCWPLHDCWPQHCTELWLRVLPTKFGCHRAFLNNSTPGWPQLTPAWPLTPAKHYILVRVSSYQIWWPYGICKATWPLTYGGIASKICSQTSWARLVPPCQISAQYLKSTTKLIAAHTYLHTDLDILVVQMYGQEKAQQ